MSDCRHQRPIIKPDGIYCRDCDILLEKFKRVTIDPDTLKDAAKVEEFMNGRDK